mgnify:CR=1 FL=1
MWKYFTGENCLVGYDDYFGNSSEFLWVKSVSCNQGKGSAFVLCQEKPADKKYMDEERCCSPKGVNRFIVDNITICI